MNEPTIRVVTEADTPALAKLLNEIIAIGGTSALEEALAPNWLADAMLTGPGVICCFVAEDGEGALAGFQSVTSSDYLPADVGDVGTFTRVGRVQRGTGSRLFEATKKAARGAGLSAINATIRADNEGGLAFYTRMGFVDHNVERAIPLRSGLIVDRIRKRFSLRTLVGV